MARHPYRILICLVALSVLFVPVAATELLSAPTLTPATVPLEPGGSQAVNATLTIIPSGSTTFNSQHSIQMTTGLLQPSWNVQVVKNGIPAAVIPSLGNAVFVNGYLLSFPSTNDVSILIAVSGTTPSTPGANVTLLQVEEIDNTNGVVPGSVFTVTAPVAASITTASTSTTGIAYGTGATSAPVTPARKSPGFTAAAGIPAAIAGFILFTARNRKNS
ncbi:MAG: hypothetical protein ABFC24_12165 [Methanoregulaceae archaeon]